MSTDALRDAAKRIVDHMASAMFPREELSLDDVDQVARAVLSVEPQAVPEGWQLVPKEPTQAMCMAMPALPPLTASDLQLRGWSPGSLMNRKRYLAALAAAPTPQEPTP